MQIYFEHGNVRWHNRLSLSGSSHFLARPSSRLTNWCDCRACSCCSIGFIVVNKASVCCRHHLFRWRLIFVLVDDGQSEAAAGQYVACDHRPTLIPIAMMDISATTRPARRIRPFRLPEIWHWQLSMFGNNIKFLSLNYSACLFRSYAVYQLLEEKTLRYVRI